MTRMWFGKEGVSDHCQMIVERVMGLGEDGTKDWDLFVDNQLTCVFHRERHQEVRGECSKTDTEVHRSRIETEQKEV